MEALQLLQVSSVQGPCLKTTEETDENDRPVHLELRGLPDVVLVQDASFQVAKSLAGLADPGTDGHDVRSALLRPLRSAWCRRLHDCWN